MAERKSKSVTITETDVLWAVGGALVGLGSNRLVNEGIKNSDKKTKDMVKKGVPITKMVGGGALALRKKTPRGWKFFGLGLAADGAFETGIAFMPEYFKIGNSDGDLFPLIGNADTDMVEIPIIPSASLEDEGVLEQEAVMGMEEMAVL